jgi:DNA-binding transcriptional LysR family regulator
MMDEVLMLNAHQLNVFLVAAETLNFTQAAQKLQMTQPSVSQHIQALEQHFDTELFIRSGRSLELTEAGLALIPLARQMVNLSIHIEEAMASLKGEVIGHLIVGCTTSPGRYLLPGLLAGFHNRHPRVRATCHNTLTSHALELLLDGKIHLALTSDLQNIPNIEYKRFVTVPISLIVPLDHPWGQREQIPLDELPNGDFILPEEGSEVHSAVRDAIAQHEFSIYHLKPIVYLGSPESIAISVSEGLGVGFVPEIVWTKLVPRRVKPVCVQGLSIKQDVYVCRNTAHLATGTLQAFWQFLFSES